jgi:biopolymer transport protein ExbD
MHIPSPRRRGLEGNLLPMINVVFLLLIFFLISAKLAPPEPFPVMPPEARPQDEAMADFTLYLGADGAVGFLDRLSAGAATDAAIINALGAERAAYCDHADCTAMPPRLLLRADAAAPATRLAALLPALAQAGFTAADLVIRTKADAGDSVGPAP